MGENRMGLIFREGLWWPEDDAACWPALRYSLPDMDLALGLTRSNWLAVQAGGNCGMWAKHLAGIFKHVWTFEPDETNFHALSRNVPANVMARRAALSDKPGRVGLHLTPGNAGAHYTEGPGEIDAVTIDGFDLPGCDLIILDVEGDELLALRGAAETIESSLPVIQIEDKGLSLRHGIKAGDAGRWLSAFGYREAGRVKRDVVYAV